MNELRPEHREEAEKFHRDLAAQGRKVRVGMEGSGHARWFERLLAELHFELWLGDVAEITPTKVPGPLAATLPEGTKLAQSLFLPCRHEMV